MEPVLWKKIELDKDSGQIRPMTHHLDGIRAVLELHKQSREDAYRLKDKVGVSMRSLYMKGKP